MPLDLDQLLVFLPAALALNVTPGADMLFCIGQGARYGPRVALGAAAGVAAGGLGHALLAAAGLAAFLAANPEAFLAIRWVGAAWLLMMAVQALRGAGDPPPEPGLGAEAAAPEDAKGAAGRAFVTAAGVSLANPKVALFTFALLPQFVDPSRGDAAAQILALGAVFGAGGVLVNGAAGAFAGGLGRALARSARARRMTARFSAAVFAVLALRLALNG